MRRQRGFTLAELAITTAAILASLGVIIAVGASVRERAAVHDAVEAINLYTSLIGNQARGQAAQTYTAANLAALNTPPPWIDRAASPAEALWPWGVPATGASVVISGAGTRADGVRLNIVGLTPNVCQGAIGIVAARSTRLTSSDGTTIVARANALDPVTPAEIRTLCATAPAAIVLTVPM